MFALTTCYPNQSTYAACSMSASSSVYLNIGDKLHIETLQNTGSTQNVSSGGATNLSIFYVREANLIASFSNGQLIQPYTGQPLTTLNQWSKSYDPKSEFDGTYFIPKTSGDYHVSYVLNYEAQNWTTLGAASRISVFRSATNEYEYPALATCYPSAGNTDLCTLSKSNTIHLNAGDKLSIETLLVSENAISITGGGNTVLSIFKVKNTNTIASLNSNGFALNNFSVGDSATNLSYWEKSFDSNNEFNGNAFIPKNSGFYHVSYSINFNGAAWNNAGAASQISVWRSSTNAYESYGSSTYYPNNGTTNGCSLGASATIQLFPGDKVSIDVLQTSGVTQQIIGGPNTSLSIFSIP